MALKVVQVGSFEGSGGSDHNKLYNKGMPDQHTIESITGLKDKLDELKLKDMNHDTVLNDHANNIIDALNTVEGVQTQLTTTIEQMETNLSATTDLLIDEIEALRLEHNEDMVVVEDNLNQAIEDVNTSIATLSNTVNLYRKDDVIRVDTEEDLVLLTPEDSMLAFVKQVEKIYAFNAETSLWNPISGGGVGGLSDGSTIAPIYEIYSAQQNQTVFNLKNHYPRGTNSLEVYLDGVLLMCARRDSNNNTIQGYDYIESASDQVEFVYPLNQGQIVIFRTAVAPINIKTVTEYTYESSSLDPTKKRIKREEITGDITRVIDYTYDNADRVTSIAVTQDGEIKTKVIEYDGDDVTRITDNGVETLYIHKTVNRCIFNITNQTELICEHNLGTRYVHVTVWVNDEEFVCTKQIIDDNKIKISYPEPITGVIVIS